MGYTGAGGDGMYAHPHPPPGSFGACAVPTVSGMCIGNEAEESCVEGHGEALQENPWS